MNTQVVDPRGGVGKPSSSVYDEAEQLWTAFVAAARRAQSSGRIEHGIVAGKLWGRWLQQFEMDPSER
jgi:hypothetical protein